MNAAAADLIYRAIGALKRVTTRLPTEYEAVLKAANPLGVYDHEDIALALAVVMQRGPQRAYEIALAEYPRDPAQDLFREFRDAWEATPFGDPDTTDFLARAAEHGDRALWTLNGMLDVYTLYAPEPNYSEEQKAEIHERAMRALASAEQRQPHD